MNIVVFFSPGKTIDDLMMIDQCGTIAGLVDVPTYVYLGHSIAYRLYHMYSTRIFQNNINALLYLFIDKKNDRNLHSFKCITSVARST